MLSALMTLLHDHGDIDGDEEGNAGGGIVTMDTGGASQGDPHAGEGSRFGRKPSIFENITQGDVIGAWVLTAVVVGSASTIFIWICTGALERRDAPPRLQEPVLIELSDLARPSPSRRGREPTGVRAATEEGSNAAARVGLVDLELGHHHASRPARRVHEMRGPQMRRGEERSHEQDRRYANRSRGRRVHLHDHIRRHAAHDFPRQKVCSSTRKGVRQKGDGNRRVGLARHPRSGQTKAVGRSKDEHARTKDGESSISNRSRVSAPRPMRR